MWEVHHPLLKGVFTRTEADTETDKKWVGWDSVEVLTKTDTVTNVNGFQTHFIGLSISVSVSVSVSVNAPENISTHD